MEQKTKQNQQRQPKKNWQGQAAGPKGAKMEVYPPAGITLWYFKIAFLGDSCRLFDKLFNRIFG